MTQTKKSVGKHRAQRGFSLLEVMIAMVVLTVGLLAVILAFGTAISATEWAQEDLIARHKALDAMESIYTARNSQQLPFASLQNIANGGIFLSGAQPLLCAGTDGIVGTADDVACTAPDTGAACPGGVECLVLPGPDGVLGTGDDQTVSLTNFTRTVSFNTIFLPPAQGGGVNTNLIGITITINYSKPGRWGYNRSYTVNGLVSSYH
jgi:prepilin-type N-terminal cleavage/methylation domain-containing protein